MRTNLILLHFRKVAWQLKNPNSMVLSGNLIPPLIAKWEPVLGVRVAAFGIRKMKTKWGSCNPKTARIVINTELIKKPVHCLDYIVLHEMVHLIERQHNERFRSVLTRHMPNWQDIRNELNNTPIPEFL